ncbi:MAG: hypothetical protein ABR582_02400 [Gemmatimonadaceae bacterium]
MYERRSVEPISRAKFVRRMLRHAGYGGLLVLGSLTIGTIGFHYLTAEVWSNAMLNAAMLLGGMGPVGDLTQTSTEGKIFASAFSLYSGLVFITASGLLAAPVFHRMLHRFHWQGASK